MEVPPGRVSVCGPYVHRTRARNDRGECTDPSGQKAEADIQEAYAAVDAFNTELQTNGSWVFAGGLEEPTTATVVDATGPDVLVTGGPYAETKEQVGGSWVVDALAGNQAEQEFPTSRRDALPS